MHENKTETVRCTRCGNPKEIPGGRLTEEQKRGFLCSACQEIVLERSVEEREKGNRELLVD
ncbi:hypothetical protein E2P64_07535 [Candidatus Bathyarchaeota archaeon]|nr:hypothetical protein E2P64_07535 [Candidatus Bathyarchaeota archaeon]